MKNPRNTAATVISFPRERDTVALATRILPHTRAKVEAPDRIYFIYLVRDSRDAHNFAYTDLYGDLLVECRYFESEPIARSWIEADVALRVAQTGGVQ